MYHSLIGNTVLYLACGGASLIHKHRPSTIPGPNEISTALGTGPIEMPTHSYLISKNIGYPPHGSHKVDDLTMDANT